MHFAIDDTYGPGVPTLSNYVTEERRTHVGVVFQDTEVDFVREQVRNCLHGASELLSTDVSEFHFVDIFNRKPPWDRLPLGANLRIFEGFCEIYRLYRWPVILSTVDKRTLTDQPIMETWGRVDELDAKKKEDLSLLLLCLKFKILFRETIDPLTLFIDEGRKRPGSPFGTVIFRNWPAAYSGIYASSSTEPLLQIADLIAFCINRSTHLQMKASRTPTDDWFLRLIGHMSINSADLRQFSAPLDFGAGEFDEQHRLDRIEKVLER